MNNLSINEILPIVYTFYNKRLGELDDNGVKTPEQEYFVKYVAKFYNKNYETWSNYMKRIAKETNTIFWIRLF